MKKPISILLLLILFLRTALAQKSNNNIQTGNWSYKDPVTDTIAGISLSEAYALLKNKTSTTIIVAVIDNGIDLDHEDLKDIIWTNTKEIPGNGIDDDDNGYVDDVHGWNFRGAKNGTIIENEQAGSTQFYSMWKNKFDYADPGHLPPNDEQAYNTYLKAKDEYLQKTRDSKDPIDLNYTYNIDYNSDKLINTATAGPNNRNYGSPQIKLSPWLSHGTHVAGIIGAIRNNNKGMDGIAGNIRIMPIVATTATGDERDKDIANAIRYAVDNGARIINMSFSKTFSPEKRLVDDAIRYAAKKNVLIVHSAGNDGINIDSAQNYHYPIAIGDDGQIADNFINVGWSRSLFDYRLAHPYSNYGKKNVDLFAPGSDILSTVPGNGYEERSGSSMSAPCVSGVAALLLSYFPSLSAVQLKDILMRSAFKPDQMVNKPQSKEKVPFNSLSVTGGIVNACFAVTLAIKKNPAAVAAGP